MEMLRRFKAVRQLRIARIHRFENDAVPNSDCCSDRVRGDFGDIGILRVSWPFSGIAAIKAISAAALGLLLIKFNSVAAAISTRMPPRLSAICIANPSEM